MALGLFKPLTLHADPLAKTQAMTAVARRAGDKLQAGIATKRSKEDGKRAFDLIEADSMLLEPGRARRLANQAMPKTPEFLFIFEKLEHGVSRKSL